MLHLRLELALGVTTIMFKLLVHGAVKNRECRCKEQDSTSGDQNLMDQPQHLLVVLGVLQDVDGDHRTSTDRRGEIPQIPFPDVHSGIVFELTLQERKQVV